MLRPQINHKQTIQPPVSWKPRGPSRENKLQRTPGFLPFLPFSSPSLSWLYISTASSPLSRQTQQNTLLASTFWFTVSKKGKEKEMASARRVSLIVAASVGAVEALKDQAGLCRWNYALRSLQQRAKSNMGSLAQTRRMSSSSSNIERMKGREGIDGKAKRSEESLRKVMYLSCWGPN